VAAAPKRSTVTEPKPTKVAEGIWKLPPTSRKPLRYWARFETADGEEHSKVVATLKEAKIWRGREKARAHEGHLPSSSAGRTTLGRYGEHWIEERPNLRPRTREQYEYLFRRHIEPKLGHLQLRRLNAPQGVQVVRRWHAGIARTDGWDAAAKAYRLLRVILRTAVQDGRLSATPCVIEGAGTEKHDERPTATVAQVDAAAAAMPPRLRAMIDIGAWCGLRLSEILALTRERVDLEQGLIRVVEGAHQVTGLGRVLEDPKTEAGRRLVDIPPHVIPELEEHLRTFVGPELDAVVFTGELGGPLTRGMFQKHWARARAAAGMPEGFVFHDLRHTGNTLAAPGASTKEIMARLGHSTSRAALIYQHATEERMRTIAGQLSERVAAERASQNASRGA